MAKAKIAVEVDHLFQEIASGRAAEFYRSRCSDELKHATSEREFVVLSESINEHLGKLQSRTVSGFTYGTNFVDAAYEAQFERGKASVRTRFVREHGLLLLQAFRVDSPQLAKDALRKKCPNCGGLYDLAAKFCPHCGAKLGDDSADENQELKSGADSKTPSEQ